MAQEKKTLEEKSKKLDTLDKTLNEERAAEKKSAESLRAKLNKEVMDAEDERKSFLALQKKSLDEEKDRIGKQSSQQLVAEEIRIQEKAKQDVEAARVEFGAKEKALRKTVLSIERAEDDMEKRTAQLVQEKMELVDKLHGAEEEAMESHKHFEEAQAKIHEAEERAQAHEKAEKQLKAAVAGREQELMAKDTKIAKEEGDLKVAALAKTKLEESIQHLNDEHSASLAKLHDDLEVDFNARLHKIEEKNLADQKVMLANQKAAFL